MSDHNKGTLAGIGKKVCKSESLAGQVCEALALHDDVDASQIGVSFDESTGDLVLSGTVPSAEQRRVAEACAVSVRGVNIVYNRLSVKALSVITDA